MKYNNYFTLIILLISGFAFSQNNDSEDKTVKGHINTNKFRQLSADEFATPNMYRSASGAPGKAYYQQQADYKMDIELDDKNQKIYV